MSARDTIKKLFQLVNDIGLPKESVHLLETRLSSLDEQLATLESQNAHLNDENEKLKIQVKCLQPQTDEMSKDTVRLLKLLFERAHDISADDISTAFKWKRVIADYHIDVLMRKRFIRESSVGMQTPFGSSVPLFGLTTLGRRYIIQYTDV
jgi:predicted  nucleic acid-binding Zn-ribbon protein